MIQEMTRRSTQVASWLTWLMAEDAALPEAAQAGLFTASGWLHTASQIAETTAEATSSMITARELLRGFPAAAAPDPITPRTRESTSGLCAGIAISAERLRGVAFTQPELAHASRYVSGPAWLRTAWAAAVVSDICAGTLHSLAERSEALTTVPVHPRQLHQAAKAFTPACAAWRQAASMWKVITTDTQATVTSATTELDDLVLRTGRLAFANPAWTPAARQRAPRRNPALLAPDRSSLLTVVGAIHQVADAIAVMAEADLAAITVIGDNGRFYMPNAILWDGRAKFRNYAAAPPDRVQLLRDVYQVIVNTSRTAATALDRLAMEARAPSRLLALARQATSARADTCAPADALDLTALAPRLKSFARPERVQRSLAEKAASQAPPEPQEKGPAPVGQTAPADQAWTARGPFESRVRALIPADRSLLTRAAAIDRAGNDLVNQVLGHARADDFTSNPARLAAQDTPSDRTRHAPSSELPPATVSRKSRTARRSASR